MNAQIQILCNTPKVEISTESLYEDGKAWAIKFFYWGLNTSIIFIKAVYIPLEDKVITPILAKIYSKLKEQGIGFDQPNYWFDEFSTPREVEIFGHHVPKMDLVITVLSVGFAIQMFVMSFQAQTELWGDSYWMILKIEEMWLKWKAFLKWLGF